MAWIEISQMALNLMHQRRKVTYFTEQELQSRAGILDHAKSDGYEVVVISEQQKAKLEAQVLSGGPQVRTLEKFVQEYNSSFEYSFVDPVKLATNERQVFDLTPKILALVGLVGSQAPQVRISQTMRVTSRDTQGVWDPSLKAIIVRRDQLSSLVQYAGTILHEAGHATTHTADVTREFELVLTSYLGNVSVRALSR